MDKTSKLIIEYIRQQPNYEYKYNRGRQNIMPEDEFNRCISFMVQKGYVKPLLSNGITIGYALSHELAHKREFNKIAFLKYLLDNWIAIVALILSIISLILHAC